MKNTLLALLLTFNISLVFAQIENTNEQVSYEAKLSKFNISVEYGFAYVLSELEGNRAVQEYYFDLYKSKNITLGGLYFINKKSGFGLLYSQIWSENSLDGVTLIQGGDTTSNITISDKLKTHFIGPQYVLRFYSKSGKTKYNLGGAFGLLYLKWEEDWLAKSTIEAYTLGIRLTAGVDIYIAKGIDLGVNLFLQNGEADYIYIDNQPFTLSQYGLDPISLSRIGFNMGIKFLF